MIASMLEKNLSPFVLQITLHIKNSFLFSIFIICETKEKINMFYYFFLSAHKLLRQHHHMEISNCQMIL